MIQVTIYRSDNQIKGFELSGHADSGPYGYDLVCAGVSAVSIGAVNAVMELCDTELEIEQGEDGGYLSVRLPDELTDSQDEKAQLLIEGMLISLYSIEQEYSQFIQIQNS
ncbi:ribosomal-processing cysteine protease Prp [Lentibacillus sediminis]|uniref:ribosomal-processing cysteine protease Prp n=1 Tax=Lentibacillus sediminis TaxID=1940529 RepID=UPI000C1C5A07|nr:ribosomal-processing cysteine protease Prp [Lentibacillus sediminis]